MVCVLAQPVLDPCELGYQLPDGELCEGVGVIGDHVVRIPAPGGQNASPGFSTTDDRAARRGVSLHVIGLNAPRAGCVVARASSGTVQGSERSNTAPTPSSRPRGDESWRSRLTARDVSSPNATCRHPSSSTASSAHATTPSVRASSRRSSPPTSTVHDDGRPLRRPARLRWCARSSSRDWVQPRRRTISPRPSTRRSTSCERLHVRRPRSPRCRSTAHRWTTTVRASPPFSRPDGELERAEDRADLAGALTVLDDDDRELLLLRYVDGLTETRDRRAAWGEPDARVPLPATHRGGPARAHRR